MAARNSTFDIATLNAEAAGVVREALAGIEGRRDARKESRRDWMRDGYDVIRIRRVAPHGSLEAILRSRMTVGIRQLQEHASAVELLACGLKHEIISQFPETAASTVCALLARETTPRAVVDEFLPRILAGHRIKLADVKNAIDAIKNPEKAAPDEPAPDRPDHRYETAQRFLRTLGAADRDLLDRLRRGLPEGLTLDFLVGLTGEPEDDQPEPTKPDPVADQPKPAAEPDPQPTDDPGVDPNQRPEPEPDPKPHPNADPAPRGDASGGSWNREAAIRRIRALMAKTVANGCTEAEALMAAEKVRRLLDKYALTMSDLEIQNQTCEQRKATEKLHDVWHVAHAISAFTGTRVWLENGCIVYFGLAHDVEVAQFLTDLCRNAMDRAFRDYLRENRWMGVDGRSARKTFLLTMARRLAKRIDNMAVERNATAKTGSGSSLVVVRDAVVDRQFDALGLRLRKMKSRPRRSFDPLAHEAAIIAAEQVNLTTGVDQDNREQVAAA